MTIIRGAMVLALAALAYYFSGVGLPGIAPAVQIVIGVVSLLFFGAAARKGLYDLWVVSLTAFTVAISLGCSFGRQAVEVTGPLVVHYIMHPFLIIGIAGFVAVLAWWLLEKGKSKDRFASVMFVVFVLNWIILAFNVRFFDDWKIENWLTVPFVIFIYISHKWFRFSNISYGLIFLYMMSHIYGSHYTYAEVPFGFWMENVFGFARNHYDRVVHFSFGFLLAYPLRELAIRVSDTKGIWGFWFPIEFVLAFSAIYEILEWWVAVVFGGDLGIAYLGSQGDIWDAQKDMGLAGLGAIVAMIVVSIVLWHIRRSEFLKEVKESFKVKQRSALGEEAIARMGK